MVWNMMGGGCFGAGVGSFGVLVGVLYSLLLIGLVILVYLWIAKLWKETSRKK